MRRALPFRHFFLALFASCALLCVLPLSAEPLPQARLQIGMHLVQAEVANTPESRTQGLMRRTELARNQGMLFIFEDPQRQAMWMRNTLLPLAVAFIDRQGVILNIEEMQPRTDTVHPSAGPASYALEMNSGWFSGHGIKPGDEVKGLPHPKRQ